LNEQAGSVRVLNFHFDENNIEKESYGELPEISFG
jgi:hypothetical protein